MRCRKRRENTATGQCRARAGPRPTNRNASPTLMVPTRRVSCLDFCSMQTPPVVPGQKVRVGEKGERKARPDAGSGCRRSAWGTHEMSTDDWTRQPRCSALTGSGRDPSLQLPPCPRGRRRQRTRSGLCTSLLAVWRVSLQVSAPIVLTIHHSRIIARSVSSGQLAVPGLPLPPLAVAAFPLQVITDGPFGLLLSHWHSREENGKR